MNRTINNWVIVILLTIVFNSLNAQISLNIKDNTGKVTSVILSDVSKLMFPAGKMTLIKKTGGNTDFILSDIQNLNFNKITDVDQIDVSGITAMVLYPNPVVKQLNIRYEAQYEESILVEVVNIQGEIIVKQTMKSFAGTNYFIIPFDLFQKGIYMCRLNNGKKIEISKFIKY